MIQSELSWVGTLGCNSRPMCLCASTIQWQCPRWIRSAGRLLADRHAAVLVGARRTPIRAIALMLQRITQAAGASIEVLVLLVHAGAGDVSPQDITEKSSTWRNFLAIHDLHVGLERWPR